MYLPDVNEFLSQSGWFSFPGLAHGKQALQHVLAKKMKLSHEVFLGIREAVYLFEYRQGEKVRLQFVGLDLVSDTIFSQSDPMAAILSTVCFCDHLRGAASILLENLLIPSTVGQDM